MEIKLFGWTFTNAKEELEQQENQKTFSPPIYDDGAVNVAEGGTFGTYIDLEGTVKTEAEMVTRYRNMAVQPEIDKAVNEITNEAIVKEDNKSIVNIDLEELEVSDKIKKVMQQEFKEVLSLMDFEKTAYDMFRRWYIDGRAYFHVVIDMKVPQEGIKEIRYIDPRTIRKIREVQKKKDTNTGAIIQKTKSEYFMYNERGFDKPNNPVVSSIGANGVRIQKDSIIHLTSGLMDGNNTTVLSYLHPAIKFLNELRALEDSSIIYHLSRATERRIFNIDVGNMPKAKAEQHVRDMMTKHKNKVQYNAVTGQHTDNRKFMCYTLDTKIPLLDGRTLSIEEIITEYENGKTNWVYSCDPITGKFYPGPISWAGVTKKNSDVVRVTFDNGKSVTCTPDHKFPVWNKGFVEAKDLSVGESMIPGYRRHKPILKNSKHTYEQLYCNVDKKWKFTHREVAKWKKDLGLVEEFVFDSVHLADPKRVIHHKNYDRYDNSPSNLIMMNSLDHNKYHSANRKIQYTNKIVAMVDAAARLGHSGQRTVDLINTSDYITDWLKLNIECHIPLRNLEDGFTYKDLLRIAKSQGHITWKKYVRHYDTRMREKSGRVKRGTCDKYTQEWKDKLSSAAKKRIPVSKTWRVEYPDGKTEIIENLNAFCREHGLNRSNIKGKSGSKGYSAEILNNHKVVSVEFLDSKHTVAALTIDQEETYHSHHTYLLDAGIYTKNTMLEDYWFPKRADGSGTTIDILQGGTQLPQLLESIEYFQDRLFRSLQVPITRMKPDAVYNIGRATEITRDEVNFSKFIDRIRGKFSELFYESLGRQLILKGYVSPEDWEQFKKYVKFKFTKDSYFSDLKDMEILSERILRVRDIDDFAGKYVSHTWVRKNILQQTDEEMEMMDKEMQAEMQDPRFAPPELEPPGQGGPPDGGN